MFNFIENQHRINLIAAAGTEQTLPQWKVFFGSWTALAIGHIDLS